jgi:hypothetical protein
MTFAHTKLGILLLCLYLPDTHADDAGNEHRTELRPQMAAFYTIDSQGRSVPENPVVAAISSPNAGATRPSARRVVKARETTPSSIISIRIMRGQRDERKAAQCERHGLFFTRDGRCVRPLRNEVQPALARESIRAPAFAGESRPTRSNAAIGAR